MYRKEYGGEASTSETSLDDGWGIYKQLDDDDETPPALHDWQKGESDNEKVCSACGLEISREVPQQWDKNFDAPCPSAEAAEEDDGGEEDLIAVVDTETLADTFIQALEYPTTEFFATWIKVAHDLVDKHIHPDPEDPSKKCFNLANYLDALESALHACDGVGKFKINYGGNYHIARFLWCAIRSDPGANTFCGMDVLD